MFRDVPVWVLSAGVGLLVSGGPSDPGGAVLRPESVAGWDAYVAATEARIARETGGSGPFLGLDQSSPGTSSHRRLTSGETVIDQLSTVDAAGDEIEVPSAMVHHWRGAVFVPGVTVDGVLARLRRGAPRADREDVLQSAILDRSDDGMRVFLRLQRRSVITVVYDTVHDVSFQRWRGDRGASTSRSVRIAEVQDAGTAGERRLPPGRDRGFLWRLNAYWRYEAVPGGIIAECESLSLSRTAPAPLRLLAGPLIRRAAREAMGRTLVSLRERLLDAGASAPDISSR